MSDWVKYFEKTEGRNIFHQCISKRRLIELIVENTPKGGRILEVGCGTALLSVILATLNFEVTASDLTQDVLDYARSKVSFNNIKLNFAIVDMLSLSSVYEKHHFDTICHSGVMEHFSDTDVIKSLSEQRIISKRVIFSVPNNRTEKLPSLFVDERLLGNKKWIQLIRASGFGSIKVFGDQDLPIIFYFILPNVFFTKRGSFWWKWFSGHSIFVCE